MKKIVFLLIAIICFACEQKEPVDLLVMNAKIYTVDNDFSIAKAFVIKEGKIIALGEGEQLLLKYKPKKVVNVDGQTIVPGLIDAHAHFLGLGQNLQQVDLIGTTSFNEVVDRIIAYKKKKNPEFIIGRGWDQNDWNVKKYPRRDTLDQLFPDTPVVLTRIDGHAMLVNKAAMDLAGINKSTKVTGGKIQVVNDTLTGIIIDKPMESVEDIIPEPTTEKLVKALLEAQDVVFKYGLTTIDDAGLDKKTIMLMDSLQQNGKLKVRLYAMVQNKTEDLDYFLNEGILKTDRLNVRSVKVYADGALGSRGAALRNSYTDEDEHFGAMITNHKELMQLAMTISKTEYQMNTHAIGDSATHSVLRVYDSILKNEEDKRWRVEHAQVLSEKDFSYFKGKKNIIPSVQPTHATSDMYWAEERLGPFRLQNAYAYQKMLKKAGIIALGTDFPVEKVNPFLTFYAAVTRKDLSGYPKGGFQKENALSREEALKGMTIWAAYANFEEEEKGSIEPGKFADFVVLDRDLMKIPEADIPKIKVMATYVNGEVVYEKEPLKTGVPESEESH